jgi:acetylornithine deacetylase/succinyl-diaminopimelate desuccinylase-like protein
MRMQTRSQFPHRCAKTVLALSLALCGIAGMTGASAQTSTAPASLTPQQQRFHDIYKELIEINTTHSTGDNTLAARAMEKRLVEAGFAPGDIQIFEPFPKKGNLVLRFKGNGSKKPLLLLAHIDVVEARREDWKTDPFKLQETGGYFTARGSIDDKAMASALVSVLGQLKQEGFKPSRDIILALTADEERGDALSNGAFWLISNKPELLQAEFGINEGGGGELRGGKPNLHRMQVAEKMYTTYMLEARDVGGHSSVPTKNNPIYALSAGLERLGNYAFPIKLADVTKTYFARSAPFATGPAGRRHARHRQRQPRCGRARAHDGQPGLQRPAAHHLRGDDGAGRPCRERAAAIGQGHGQLPHPAARRPR